MFKNRPRINVEKRCAHIHIFSQGYGQHWRGARTRHNLMSKMKTSVKLILTGAVVVHLAVLRAYNVSEASRASSRPLNTDNIGGPVTLRMLSLLRSEIIRTTLTIIVPITRAMCVCCFFHEAIWQKRLRSQAYPKHARFTRRYSNACEPRLCEFRYWSLPIGIAR